MLKICPRRLASMWGSYVTGSSNVPDMYDQLVRKNVIVHDANQRTLAEACAPLIHLIRQQPPPSAVAGTDPLLDGDSVLRLASRAGERRQRPASGRLRGRDAATPFSSALQRMRSGLGSLFQPSASGQLASLHSVNIGVVEKRGLYLWGSVGIGKTMMLDLFDLCDTPLPKRRAHLHSFMTDIAERLVRCETDYRARRRAARTPELQAALARLRPMDLVVDEVLRESPVLCFDEFQTFDVAHAALLASFFASAFERGLFLVTTSNRPPEDLCQISSTFSAFLPLIDAYCEVVHCPGDVDYRTARSAELGESCHANVFVFPNNVSTARRLVERVERCLRAAGPPEWVRDEVLRHHGRSLRVPFQCRGVALFDFREICGKEQNLSSADFQIIARNFHTVVVSNVPQIGVATRNDAHQFIVLVDELYQHNVKLLFTCQVPWTELMSTRVFHSGGEKLPLRPDDSAASDAPSGGGGGSVFAADSDVFSEGEDDRSGYAASYNFRNEEERLSFTRIESRLREMGSRHYLLRDHGQFIVSDFDFSGLVTGGPEIEAGASDTPHARAR